MSGGTEEGGAPTDVTEEQDGASSVDVHRSPKQENPEQLTSPMPGTSQENPQALVKTESASKATSPLILPDETEPEKPFENEGFDHLEDILQGVKIEEIGPFATRMKFEETKGQFDRLGEVMKERAIMAMMECLNMQQQQQQQQQPRGLPVPARGLSQDVASKRSLNVSPMMQIAALRASLAPPSVRTVRSENSLNCVSTASCKAKSAVKRAKLGELEKQLNSLERQCRILDRHIREHERDQKSMQTKIHRLEMKILHDGQKQMIWDMMEKIPTEDDLKIIGSFHSFALERKRTESQIKVLNIRVKALNTSMGKMSIDPLQIEKNILSTELTNMKQASIARLQLPDFTSMTLQEREEFFRKSGVTLYEYDRDSPERDDVPQQKQRGRKFKIKKVNILEDSSSSEAPSSRPNNNVAGGKRKSRGSNDSDGNESPAPKITKSKSAKSAKNSKLGEDTPSSQSIQFTAEKKQLVADRKALDNELTPRLAEDGGHEKSPSGSSEDGSDGEGSPNREASSDADQNQANSRQSSPDDSNPNSEN